MKELPIWGKMNTHLGGRGGAVTKHMKANALQSQSESLFVSSNGKYDFKRTWLQKFSFYYHTSIESQTHVQSGNINSC